MNPSPGEASFKDLGLSELIVDCCQNIGYQTPRRVQQHCIPKILEGRHVIGIDETGSGKTIAFILPILHRLLENPSSVFALVVTPTRDFACELADKFTALGQAFGLDVVAVFGGMDIHHQTERLLTGRPHIVIATPGRINVLLQDNPEIADMFVATKFIVLNEADKVLHYFDEELKSIFRQVRSLDCQNIWFQTPRRVQQHCIPKILEGRNVVGIDETGSGKTIAFILPILHRFLQNPSSVFALVVTPTRDFAFKVAEQFLAFGRPFGLRLAVVVGGFGIHHLTKRLLTGRPHIVIATPWRINVLLQNNPEIADIFAATKFLVLDEADEVLDKFEELKSILGCLPKNRQNLLFSTKMTTNMQNLCDNYQEKPYVYACIPRLMNEGFKLLKYHLKKTI